MYCIACAFMHVRVWEAKANTFREYYCVSVLSVVEPDTNNEMSCFPPSGCPIHQFPYFVLNLYSAKTIAYR